MGGRRTERTGGAARSAAVAVGLIVVVLATGCQWVLPAYDAANTRHNPTETQIGVAEVPTLTARWTATLGSSSSTTAIPVVARGVVVTSTGGRLLAFSTDGSRGCTSSAPAACSPIWSSPPGRAWLRQPVISGDRVLALAEDASLQIYDLAGVEGCAGSPVVCAPIGTVPGFFSGPGAALTLDGGRVYVSGAGIAAFDLDDLLACAAASQTCEPLWRRQGMGPLDFDEVADVAISGGVLYALTERLDLDFPSLVDVRAFDLAACEAASTCDPTWQSEAVAAGWAGSIAVDSGMVVVRNAPWTPWDPELASPVPSRVLAYAVSGCAAAAPGPCPATWTAEPGGFGNFAIAGGAVYVPSIAAMVVYDLDGVTGCSGAPNVCQPLRTLVDPANGTQGASPVVANGVVHLGPDAWSADGSVGCSGTPVTCSPLRSGQVPAEVVVVNGRAFLQQTPTTAPAKLVVQTPG